MGLPDDAPNEDERVGLWYPADWVLPRYAVWRLSGYAVFPDGKSYNEQPRRLLDDFNLLNRRLGYWIQREKPKGGAR